MSGSEVFPTRDALMEASAELFVTLAASATDSHGRFTVALSGGATPRALYERLAGDAFRARVNWSHARIFWGDERCVPPHDAASNARMAREAVLDRVSVPKGEVHRIHGEDAPAAAAVAYERELRVAFGTPVGAPRHEPGGRFDLVLLGLGTDGHTASLFPGLSAVREKARWVVAEYAPPVSAWRVTVTPAVINAAADVLFVVSGRDKASIVRRVLAGERDPYQLPAQLIAPAAGRLRWMLDADAAAEL